MERADLWYAYLLQCERNRLYAGVSRNVLLRFKQHQSGHGALFTRLFTPIALVGAIPVGSRTHAQRFEKQVKTWTPQRKLRLFEKFGLNDFLPNSVKYVLINHIVDSQAGAVRIDGALLEFMSSFTHIPLSRIYEALQVDPPIFNETTISDLRLANLIQLAFDLNEFYSRNRNTY